MSKFRTVIPVDIKGLLAKLPAASFVDSISMLPDGSGVAVEWQNDNYRTPYTYPVDCPEPGKLAPVGAYGAQPSMSGQRPNSPSQQTKPAADAARVKKKTPDASRTP